MLFESCLTYYHIIQQKMYTYIYIYTHHFYLLRVMSHVIAIMISDNSAIQNGICFPAGMLLHFKSFARKHLIEYEYTLDYDTNRKDRRYSTNISYFIFHNIHSGYTWINYRLRQNPISLLGHLPNSHGQIPIFHG